MTAQSRLPGSVNAAIVGGVCFLVGFAGAASLVRLNRVETAGQPKAMGNKSVALDRQIAHRDTKHTPHAEQITATAATSNYNAPYAAACETVCTLLPPIPAPTEINHEITRDDVRNDQLLCPRDG
jgi:hypothetical protein